MSEDITSFAGSAQEEREREHTVLQKQWTKGRSGYKDEEYETELEGHLRVLSKDKRVDKADVIAGMQSQLKQGRPDYRE